MNLAIIGATGNVGRKTIEILENSNLTFDKLFLVASSNRFSCIFVLVFLANLFAAGHKNLGKTFFVTFTDFVNSGM